MNEIARYLLTLICGAFVCALIKAMAGDGPGKGIRDLICGLFLLLLAVKPLGGLEWPELELSELQEEAEAAALEGVGQAMDSRDSIISREIEAYICTQADRLGMNLTARVTLDGDSMPHAVTLSGAWTETLREKLTQIISKDLGIPEEAQIWKN